MKSIILNLSDILKNSPIFIALLFLPYTNVSFNVIFNTYIDLTFIIFYIKIFLSILFVVYIYKKKDLLIKQKSKVIFLLILFLSFRYLSTLFNIGFSLRELFFLLSDLSLILFMYCIYTDNKNLFISSFFWLITILLFLSVFFETFYPERITKTIHTQTAFTGIFKNRNNIQLVLVPYIYIIFYNIKNSIKYKYIYYLLLVITIVILIKTESLTTIISLFCSFLFIVVVFLLKKFNISFNGRLLMILLVISFLFVIISINNIDFFNYLSNHIPRFQSFYDRIVIWYESILNLKNHWLIGVGSTGTFIVSQNAYMEAHNFIINLIQVSGLIGCFSIIRSLDICLIEATKERDLAYIALVFSYIVIGITECVFSSANICMWFILILYCYNSEGKSYKKSDN